MNASPVKNVVFDFGGVLVRWQPDAVIASFYADEALRPLVLESVIRHPDWIDLDRGPNIESAGRLGFRTIHFTDARQCRRELAAHLGQ